MFVTGSDNINSCGIDTAVTEYICEHGTVEDVANECGFAGTTYAGDYRHDIKREFHVNTSKIVGACALDFDVIAPWSVTCGALNDFLSCQIFYGITLCLLWLFG